MILYIHFLEAKNEIIVIKNKSFFIVLHGMDNEGLSEQTGETCL